MQLCLLWGDMSSNKADEQYPQANICNTCIKKFENSEDSPIVNVIGPYNPNYGKICALCQDH